MDYYMIIFTNIRLKKAESYINYKLKRIETQQILQYENEDQHMYVLSRDFYVVSTNTRKHRFVCIFYAALTELGFKILQKE